MKTSQPFRKASPLSMLARSCYTLAIPLVKTHVCVYMDRGLALLGEISPLTDINTTKRASAGNRARHFGSSALFITGNLITRLRLRKNTTFSAAIHCVSDIIQNVRAIFETLGTRLFKALCDVKTDGKMSDRNIRNGCEEKVPSDQEHRN